MRHFPKGLSSLILIGFLLLSSLLVAFKIPEGFPNDPLEPSLIPITIRKEFPTGNFMGKPFSNGTVTATFYTSGAILIYDSLQNSLSIPLAISGIQLYHNSTHIAYHFSNKIVDAWLYFGLSKETDEATIKMKVTISGTANQALNISFPLVPNNAKTVSLGNNDHSFACGAKGTFVFNWTDCSQAILQKSPSYAVLFPVNGSFSIDPTLIATTSYLNYGVCLEPQGKLVWANATWWYFYSDATNLVYRTSPDGTTWSITRTVRACRYGSHFAIHYNSDYSSSYIYYAYANGSAVSNPLVFCRGTFQNTTYINWGTEYTVETSGSVAYNNPNLAIGLDGRAYVGCDRGALTFGVHFWWTYINANNDGSGSWIGSRGSVGSTVTGSYLWCGSFEPLLSNKTLTVYGTNFTGRAYNRLWNGTAWGTEAAVLDANTLTAVECSPINGQTSFGTCGYGDNVLFMFINGSQSEKKLRVMKYVYGSGWGASELATSTASYNAGAWGTIDTTDGTCYIFWRSDQNTIKYIRRSGSSGTYSSETAFESSAPSGGMGLGCSARRVNNQSEVGLAYEVDGAFLCALYFDKFTFGNVFLSTPINATSTDTLTINFTYTPSMPVPIVNSSLWLNLSGTWQAVAWNTSAIVNEGLNGIEYTFSPAAAKYVWNIKVFGQYGLGESNPYRFAVANWTLTLADSHYPTFSNIGTTLDTSNFRDIYSTNDNGYQNYQGTNYTTAHNSSTALYEAIDTNLYVGQTTAFGFYTIYRSYVMFNTTILGLENVVVNSAEIWLYTLYPFVTGANFSVVVQSGVDYAYPHVPLVLGDWNQSLYYGNGGSFDTANLAPRPLLSQRSWNTIPLNVQGIGWLNTSGITKFTLKSSRDLDYITPTGSEYVMFYSADSNLLYAPRLIINAWNGTASQTYSLSCLVNDNWNVSKALSYSNNTGSWQAVDVTPSSGWVNSTSFWANFSLTLNTTGNTRIEIYRRFNDTSNLANQTVTYVILTTVTVGNITYIVEFTFSPSLSFTDLNNPNFHVPTTFTPTISFTDLQKADFNIPLQFSPTMVFTYVSGFMYEMLSSFNPIVTFENLLNPAFGLPLNFNPSLNFSTLLGSQFGILSSFDPALTFDLLVNRGLNVFFEFLPNVSFSQSPRVSFNILPQFVPKLTFTLDTGQLAALIRHFQFIWIVMAGFVTMCGGIGGIAAYYRRRKKGDDLSERED